MTFFKLLQTLSKKTNIFAHSMNTMAHPFDFSFSRKDFDRYCSKNLFEIIPILAGILIGLALF